MRFPVSRVWGFQLDSHTWRADLLRILLAVALSLGVVVYGFSIYWAWQQAMWVIIAVDTAVLASLAAIWWLDHLSYRFRALAVCVTVYFLGTMLLTVAGSVGQLFLLGHVVVTTLLLSLRAGLISVAINSLTLVALGLAGLVLWETPPAGWSGESRDWVLLALNFLLVASILTLLVGVVLGTLEQALSREVATQHSLRERKQRLETLIDATPDGVLVLGKDGALLEINASGLTLLDCDVAEVVIGRPFEMFVATDYRERFRSFHKDICDGRGGSFECDLIGLRQQPLNVEIVSAPLPHGTAGNQHLAIARDVTDNRKLAEQVRRSQHLDAIGKLTGGIAHDFNNLLTVILGIADELHKTLDNDSGRQSDVATIRSAAEGGAVLTQRLLAFSRQQELDPRPTDVGELLHGMEPLLRRTLGEHVELMVKVSDGERCVARIDPHQLANAVLNLCINSRDAMPDGGYLTLEVEFVAIGAERSDLLDDFSPGDYVLLTVTDTGEGMPQEVASRAFEPFFTTKETGKGTGLGLSMVYGFVKQSSGQAKIYSEPGHGTSVKLYLQAVPGSAIDEPVAPDLRTTRVEPNTIDKVKDADTHDHILVVEDNQPVLDLVTRQLRSLGYRTTSARNGPEALALLKEGKTFDLLLTDIVMPGGMNGRQLADEAIRLHPGLPVLFTSGYTEMAITRDGALPPGSSLLSKPYRRADLAARLSQLLSFTAESQPSGK
ncbi:MAG TPA: ATP-binding protein [Woeseiaceae bacterium]